MFNVSIEAAEYVAAPSSILQPATEQIYNIHIKPHITSVYIIINATLEDGCIWNIADQLTYFCFRLAAVRACYK